MKRSIVIICYLILFVILQVPAFGKLNTSTDSDLQDLCESLNLLVLPEYITHASLTLLFLCSGSWFTFLLNFLWLRTTFTGKRTALSYLNPVCTINNESMQPELRF